MLNTQFFVFLGKLKLLNKLKLTFNKCIILSERYDPMCNEMVVTPLSFCILLLAVTNNPPLGLNSLFNSETSTRPFHPF
jgi:hypothetical protein